MKRSLLLKLILFLLSFSKVVSITGQQNNTNFQRNALSVCDDTEVVSAKGELFFISQKKRNDCWFVCYLMLKSWKEQREVSYKSETKKLEGGWKDLWRRNNGGITDKNQDSFVKYFGLGFYPPANYFFDSYKEYLVKHGPLIIITGDYKASISHARILFKIECNDNVDSIYFYLYDPYLDKVLKWNAIEYFEKFEEEAKGINEKGHTSLFDWRYQIMFIK